MYEITSRFLEQESFRKKPHFGYDFSMKDHTPLRAVEDGIATVKNYGNENAGLTVKIKLNDGKELIYGHMESTSLHTGDVVHRSDLIGYSGHSGHVVSSSGGNGAHLHFGMKDGAGHFVDPAPYVDQIQNMNNPELIQKTCEKIDIVQKQYSLTDLWNEQASMYQDFFSSFKLNVVHIFTSIDYTIFVQHLQNLLQLFTG
jgi:hypothetical protein